MNVNNAGIGQDLIRRIHKEAAALSEPPRLMEVCGTHTVAIFRNGLRQLLDGAVELVSGPGCPVCVTPDNLIDRAIAYADQGYIVASFGDMLRVPGTVQSLAAVRATGAAVRVVTSPLEVIELAQTNPTRQIVFFAVGFETTAPGTALLLEKALTLKIENIRILTAHKLIPPAMQLLLEEEDQSISGFICPGHVAAITGTQPFQDLSRKYRIPAVVAGFEATDLLMTILMLVRQIRTGQAKLENEYRRVVRPEGNPQALRILERYFEDDDTEWRGFGVIPRSGLALRPQYQDWDAARTIPAVLPRARSISGCRCGEVLRGNITPRQCGMFATQCTPQTPMGPCMVSGEGVCLTYYQYRENDAMDAKK